MKQNESELNANLHSSTSPVTPSHDHLEQDSTPAEFETSQKHMDQVAMEAAKRAENRIHKNEERTPEDSIFSK